MALEKEDAADNLNGPPDLVGGLLSGLGGLVQGWAGGLLGFDQVNIECNATQ